MHNSQKKSWRGYLIKPDPYGGGESPVLGDQRYRFKTPLPEEAGSELEFQASWESDVIAHLSGLKNEGSAFAFFPGPTHNYMCACLAST